MPLRLLSLSGLARPRLGPPQAQHLPPHSASRCMPLVPSGSAPVDTGRAGVSTGARARARGDQAGGYWCMTGRSVGLSVHGQRCPACPDRAKAVRRRSVPLPKSSSPAAAGDAWRRRPCDLLSDLAHSETAQAVRVRILSRLTASVTYHTLCNASPARKRPPSGAQQNYRP